MLCAGSLCPPPECLKIGDKSDNSVLKIENAFFVKFLGSQNSLPDKKMALKKTLPDRNFALKYLYQTRIGLSHLVLIFPIP